jgi:hypothetical protein
MGANPKLRLEKLAINLLGYGAYRIKDVTLSCSKGCERKIVKVVLNKHKSEIK